MTEPQQKSKNNGAAGLPLSAVFPTQESNRSPVQLKPVRKLLQPKAIKHHSCFSKVSFTTFFIKHSVRGIKKRVWVVRSQSHPASRKHHTPALGFVRGNVLGTRMGRLEQEFLGRERKGGELLRGEPYPPH